MSLRRRRHYEDHAIVEIEEALPSRRKERSPWTMIPRRLWIHWTIASRQKSYYLTLLFLSLLLFLVPTSQSVEVEVDLEGNSPPRSSSVSRKVHSLTFAFSLGLNAVRTKLSDFYTRAGPDFGGIEVFSLQYAPRHFYRMIEGESEAWYNQDKALQLHHMDEDWHSYNERWEELDWEDPSLRKECHPLPFSSSQHQNCNTLHELSLGREVENPLQQFRRRYLAHGAFRDTWLLESIHDQVVLKAFRLAASDVDFSWHSGKYIFKEALIMEKTSASNRTNNMYGHCYSSVLVEFGHEISQRIVQGEEYRGRGRITQKELDELQVDDVHPFNDFDAEEKLEIALSMAEGIAILHGHEEGVIMNDDVHPDQWLVDANGNVKLNDFSK